MDKAEDRDTQQFRVENTAGPDIRFTGRLIAKDTSAWPEFEFFETNSSKFVLRWAITSSGGIVQAHVRVFDNLDDFVAFVRAEFGLYSSPIKALFEKASKSYPLLGALVVQDI